MPDITLRYTQFELEDFIRQMLAAKGLRPKNDTIRFSPRQVNGESGSLDVIIDCEPGPMLDRCPVCQTRLVDGVPVVPEKVQAVPAQLPPRDYPVEGREYSVPAQDPVYIDSELGETFDPPSPGEGAPSVSVDTPDEDASSGGGSMTSLMALNKRLTAERERELTAQRRGSGGRRMPGESSRPPRPGEGS